MRDDVSMKPGYQRWIGALGILLIAGGVLLDRQVLAAPWILDEGLSARIPDLAILGVRIGLVLAGILVLSRIRMAGAVWAGAPLLLAVVVHAFAVQPKSHQVLDCRSDAVGCYLTEISHYYGTDCWEDRPTNCRPLRRGLRNVAFIGDATNYVQGEMSRDGLVAEAVAVDLREPWDIEFLPDGNMLVTERHGRVVHITPTGDARSVLVLAPLVTHEVGLMGMAVDPEFPRTGFVYVYYTTDYDLSDPAYASEEPFRRRVYSRISRFTMRGDSLREEHVLLDSIPGSAMHGGGRLELGPDGKLYATTGDAHAEHSSQDPRSLIGKILRLERDGSVPADNPVAGSYAYSHGHRNAQGLAWHPETGALYETENGPDRFDELNRIAPGANYGWPVLSCTEPYAPLPGENMPVDVAPPFACYETFTLAPSGMTFVADRASPWYGNLFVAGMRGRHVRRYRFDSDAIAHEEVFWVADDSRASGTGRVHRSISRRLRDVKYHDGWLYVLGDQYGLVRLRPVR